MFSPSSIGYQNQQENSGWGGQSMNNNNNNVGAWQSGGQSNDNFELLDQEETNDEHQATDHHQQDGHHRERVTEEADVGVQTRVHDRATAHRTIWANGF